MLTYATPDAATIKALRARFPKSYGDEIIDVLQNTLTEEAYKAILEKVVKHVISSKGSKACQQLVKSFRTPSLRKLTRPSSKW
jgi:hypothetical protein